MFYYIHRRRKGPDEKSCLRFQGCFFSEFNSLVMLWSFQSKGHQSTVGIGGTNVAYLTTDIIKFNNLSVKFQHTNVQSWRMFFSLDDYRSYSAQQTPGFCWRWFTHFMCFSLYLKLFWLLNVRNVQIFCSKSSSLDNFGLTNREQRHICMVFCAHVIQWDQDFDVRQMFRSHLYRISQSGSKTGSLYG